MRSSSRRRSASRGVFQRIGTVPRPDPPRALCRSSTSRRTLRAKPGCAPRRAARSNRRAERRNGRSQKIPDSPGRNAGLSRKKYRTLQEETPDSPGRNTGLSRKKRRTLQEEIPDSPGRNAGLSRKKYRTLQEETPDSPGRNTGLSGEYALEFSCKL